MVSIKQFILSSIPSLIINSSARKNSDSPVGAIAIAEFPAGGSQSVNGFVKFSALNNGSVQVDVNLSELPSTGGPLLYHIHEAPVPDNGDCLATLAHFNPNNGNATDCPSQGDNSLCELGDLSGKYGKIYNTDFQTSYVEKYLSLNPNNSYYFADEKRSITIHFANTSRIACANIELTNTGGKKNTSNDTTTATISTQTGNSGNKVGFSGAAVLAAAAALLM